MAGLYSMTSSDSSESIKLIEISIALADAAPLEAGAAAGKYMPITKFGTRAHELGYHFRVLRIDNSGGAAEIYQQETEGQPKMGKVHNYSKFGVCAFPAEYGKAGRKTFIINEGNTMFWKDTRGQAVMEWPSDEELRKEWQKVD